jgi:hypothetical protein
MERRPTEAEKKEAAPFSLSRLLLTFILSLAAILGSTLYAHLKAAEDTDTRREACIHACERDYTNCRDTTGARLDTFDAPSNIIGTGAACDRELKECLRRCH